MSFEGIVKTSSPQMCESVTYHNIILPRSIDSNPQPGTGSQHFQRLAAS